VKSRKTTRICKSLSALQTRNPSYSQTFENRSSLPLSPPAVLGVFEDSTRVDTGAVLLSQPPKSSSARTRRAGGAVTRSAPLFFPPPSLLLHPHSVFVTEPADVDFKVGFEGAVEVDKEAHGSFAPQGSMFMWPKPFPPLPPDVVL